MFTALRQHGHDNGIQFTSVVGKFSNDRIVIGSRDDGNVRAESRPSLRQREALASKFTAFCASNRQHHRYINLRSCRGEAQARGAPTVQFQRSIFSGHDERRQIENP